MKMFLYEWIQNISVYTIIMAAVMQLIANKEYQKYFRFYSGLLLVLLLCTPLLRITNMEHTFQNLFRSVEFQQEKHVLEDYETYVWKESKLWEERP